jgi:hypothetical protein
MATTGAIMKYSAVFSKYMSFIDLGMVRYIHNNLSPFFTAALGLMALSGLYMYFYTLPARKKSASTPPSSNLS